MPTPQSLTIYWCRRDFRLTDNPALFSAVSEAQKSDTPFVALYILDDAILGKNHTHPNIGHPRRLFLSRALAHFATQLPHFQIVTGNPSSVFQQLSQQYQLQIFANEDIEPYAKQRDLEVSNIIKKQGGSLRLFVDQLTAPRQVRTGSGNLYSVFTPFKKAVWNDFLSAEVAPTVTVTDVKKLSTISLHIPKIIADSEVDLQSQICTNIDAPWTFLVGEKVYDVQEILGDTWKSLAGKLEDVTLNSSTQKPPHQPATAAPRQRGIWTPDYSNFAWQEREVLQQFSTFAQTALGKYKTGRDELALQNGTSSMSVALKWGLVSSRTLKNMVIQQFGKPDSDTFILQSHEVQKSVESYISELIWREFYRYILHHNPQVLTTNYQQKYQGEGEPKWLSGKVAHQRFEAWMKGETGYDLVDAGMKQIAQTGWMHNRTRMVVGSILTKNLGIDWRWGQEYFRAMLLDLDEASNNGGWQWAGSVGADPKPIRIFNPYLQERYDCKRTYIKKWLGDEPRIIQPIVEHAVARDEAKGRYGLST